MMTTPEKFRRRQRIEGVALILLGIFTFGLAIFFNEQDARQSACLRDNFSTLTKALDARALLVEEEAHVNEREAMLERREAVAQRQVFLVFADAARGASERTPTPADQERSRELLIRELLQYQRTVETVRVDITEIRRERATIQKEREANPIPKFPEGACD